MKSWEDAKEYIIKNANCDEEFAMFYYDLVTKLSKRRKELRIPLRQLAYLTNTNYTTIKNYERCTIVIKISTLYKICKVLGAKIILEDMNNRQLEDKGIAY